jgi:hypothetical protein
MTKGSETDMLSKRQGGKNRENNDNRMDAKKGMKKEYGRN